MKYIDLTLPTPAENLACDEALLDACEDGSGGEILRFWEPKERFVVVGYANEAAREVNLDACRMAGVPILRRCSGGGTVLQGQGCLNYSVILKIDESKPTRGISETNRFVLERNRAALGPLVGSEVGIRGHTDLAIGNLKFSGNAQRRKRAALIFHGTILLQFDIAQVASFLRPPSKQPDYRRNRTHDEFLANLSVLPDPVKAALRLTWNANDLSKAVPQSRIEDLVLQKYSRDDWNLKS
jgi:lipoate-protein ligase A